MTCRVPVVLAFVVVALAPAAHALDLQPRFDPLARRLLEDGVAVGFVVGIVKDGQTQVVPYGEVKKGSGMAPNGDTVYEIGSITKLFTGILLADMMLQGVVKLDAPLQQYLPVSVEVPVFDGQPITLRHLVTHTSGLPRDPEFVRPFDRLNPYAHFTVGMMYRSLSGYRLRWPPGHYEYSNLGMGLLGHALMLQAGKTYEQLLAERICAPLGMHDTHPNPAGDTLRRLAPPYNEMLRPSKNYDLAALAGAGGIRSTVHDMLKFIEANLAGGDTPLAQAIRLSHGKRHTLESGKAIGLAWNISKDGRIVFHGGQTGGYRAFLAVAPGRNAGIVVLSNTRNARIVQFGDRLIHLVLADPRAKTPAAAPESAEDISED